MITPTNQRINAREMGQAVAHDPQFNLPKNPLLSKALVQIPIENGIVFDGCEQPQILKGNATVEFLPKLIELLNGRHSLEEIKDLMVGYSDKNIYDALSLLYTRGLLQEGNAEIQSSFTQYLERNIDQTRVNHSVKDALSRLNNYELILNGSDEKKRLMKKALINYSVTVSELEEDTTSSKQKVGIGICEDIENMSLLKEFDLEMNKLGIPWILVTIDDSNLYVGPYFSKEDTLCFDCYLNQIIISPTDKQNHNRYFHNAAISIAVAEIVNFLTRISASQIYKGVKKTNLKNISTHLYPIARLPYCEQCDFHPDKNAINNEVVEYESLVGFPSHRLLNPKDHQSHYKPSNIQLSKFSKEYPSFPKIKLPSQEDLPLLGSDVKSSFIYDLSKIMLYTCGFKKESIENQYGKAKRWAPTGGNLGSQNIYFVNNNLQELERGTYYYEATNHSLAKLSGGNEPDKFESMLSDASPHCLGYLILTGEFEKVSQKYRDFAYRIINLDAGVALTQLTVVANALNKNVHVHEFMDEGIENWLNIISPGEIITTVVSIEERTNLE
ncbi:SagB family peptide dehydrogenase [Alkalihalobacillus sp. R86527]|uniref:SagB family peptide dehydrogenase n=1 Tax=Alkalihalobacillus sp. R86527 TaxID=3093863 RepID=UPI0036722093